MLDDTLAYLSIIAIGIWTNRQLKKEKALEEKQAKEDKEKGLMQVDSNMMGCYTYNVYHPLL